MAVHLSIGRISSISLLAFLVLAVAAGTAQYLSRSGSEPAIAPAAQVPASQIAASQIAVAVPNSSALEPVAAGTLPGSPAEIATRHDPGFALAAARATPETVVPEPVTPNSRAAEPAASEPAPPRGQAEIASREVAAWKAASPPAASPPSASPSADAHEDESGSATAPAAPRGRITVTRLAVARLESPAPPDLAVSALRSKNLAPIPTRAPRAAAAGSITVRSAAMLFQSGAEIRIEKDANLYIAARNIPANDRLLEAYNADRPNGGRVRTRFGEATAAPGLLGIAAQAHRAQGDGQGTPAYSLADAMRDAIWRKETAARLKSLTLSQSACAEGAGDTAKSAPSIGLVASC